MSVATWADRAELPNVPPDKQIVKIVQLVRVVLGKNIELVVQVVSGEILELARISPTIVHPDQPPNLLPHNPHQRLRQTSVLFPKETPTLKAIVIEVHPIPKIVQIRLRVLAVQLFLNVEGATESASS